MKLNKLSIEFEEQDMFFLKKYGRIKAQVKVRRHYKTYKTPFIFDVYQLAHIVGLSRRTVFSLSKKANTHYKLIILRKKSGGFRLLHAPDSELKSIQTKILEKILNKFPVSEFATAYVKGKSLSDNAAPHINHKHLLKMDITDFFGNITYLQVISSAFNSKMYPPQIGAILTSLCCFDEVLPQGAPTSPMLSNIVMKSFDDAIGHWCKKRGITYTRYCDDLTFSADIPLYSVYLKVSEMLARRGFEVNKSKTKFVTNTAAQMVTGLTVNEKVSIPRDYKATLRQEVYYALKFGIADSILKGNKTEYIKDGIADVRAYYNHLKGKMIYVLGIESDNRWFKEAKDRLEAKFLIEIKMTQCT